MCFTESSNHKILEQHSPNKIGGWSYTKRRITRSLSSQAQIPSPQKAASISLIPCGPLDRSVHIYGMLVTRQTASSTLMTTWMKLRPVVGAPETAPGLPVGGIPPIIVRSIPPCGAGEGPRYLSKKDDVGGGISGGNWCWPARGNSRTPPKEINSFP